MVINEVEYLKCLLTIYSFVNFLFTYFAYFSAGLFIFIC